MLFLTKIKDWVVVVLLFLIVINQCSLNNTIKQNKKEIQKIRESVENFKPQIIKSFDSISNIHRLMIVRDVLYDQNAIVRTVVRPDDRIAYYNSEIEKILKGK